MLLGLVDIAICYSSGREMISGAIGIRVVEFAEVFLELIET